LGLSKIQSTNEMGLIGTASDGSPDSVFAMEYGDGGFARLAQATYLLRNVFRNISDSTLDESFPAEEIKQLDRTLRALVNASEVKGKKMRQVPVCGETAVCYR
jgi:hypothetical protein